MCKDQTVQNVSYQLQNLMEQKQVSFGQLAIRSKVPESTIKHVVYGNSQNPGVWTLCQICHGLGITMSDFFEEIEHEGSIT